MNKNVENTIIQIDNTLETLRTLDIIRFIIPHKHYCDKKENIEQITWDNHQSGRDFCGKAFTTIQQYMAILSTNSYQVLLKDYSIIRYSFKFMGSKLLSQNLLWWPCPVKMEPGYEEEFGLVESVQVLIEDSKARNYLRMRTPIRIDFDVSNNKAHHPRAHIHMQHHESRINSNEPICFNAFIRFVLENCYPELIVDYRMWNFLNYQYEDKNKKIEYINKTRLEIQV